MRSSVPDTAPHATSFSREEWANLRDDAPLTLTEDDLRRLRGLNEPMPMAEVVDVYLPLARLINLHVDAARRLAQVVDTFLARPSLTPPFVVGIAGSVAAGKSTIARVMQALLQAGRSGEVSLVTTDGFLYDNAELESRGLLTRKGFPESYDLRRLVRFLADVKAGVPAVPAPVYSHLSYDIVPGEEILVRRPDVLILEGVNVLQAGRRKRGDPRVVVSDFFDFSIYVDADEPSLRAWYVDRFLRLRETAFRDPASYFHRFASLPPDEATALAVQIWQDINYVNLKTHIEGTRDRATVVLRKGAAHAVEEVLLHRAPDATPR